MSTPLKSSTKWPETIHRRTRLRACSASAVRLKFHTAAAAPKHMAMWNHIVTPWGPARNVPECAGSRTGHWRYVFMRSCPKILIAATSGTPTISTSRRIMST